MEQAYDVIVVGTGHSGLVATGYLARAGLRVLALERRDIVGGTCVTEEIFPGYRGSSVANASHSLDPRIARELELEKHGLRFAHPPLGSLTLFEDGRALPAWPDRAKRRAVMEQFAHGDADLDGYASVIGLYASVARQMKVSFYDPPPSFAEVAARFTTPRQRRDFESIMFGPVADILEERLSSPQLQAFFAGTAVATNFVGPRTPGSGYLLLQRPLWEESLRSVGSHDDNELMMRNAAPMGGIGAITGAMAESARAHGATILTGAEVERILCEDQRVVGVALRDGREFRAPRVVSNANPKLTLTELVGPEDIGPELYDLARAVSMKGTSAKVHLALDGTPRFAAARDEEENRLFLGTNFRIAASIDVLQNAYNEAVLGRWSRRPTVTAMIDSAHDPSLTPPGCHFVSISVRGVPYHLAEGTWDEQRDDLGKAVVGTLEQHIPNLSEILAGVHVYSPLDLEREFALVEGNGAHGDIVPGHIFDSRPIPGCADYRTPVEGLYLTGVGNWPGNFMSGVTGYNASDRVLADLRRTTD
ncbi:thiamine biosynthesis protein [Micromonospora echinospora]|uniref:Pyridine nucleotide-disulfide oxidoreductase domain-containing protein 2 n=1 Tax=Micromonospora echinospora TaxID=1877 RepID=A0A1C4Z186_MICEC|nr:NAD(P)/FAD-dependent oxidoreductase [Micromonospora echinospora]OZV77470.1 thiamine biosynthesis protein [Micromonospora echinospora]SCF26713.1 Phytoene dehydrogenase-related protein [Micromonospora echinospora]